MTVVAEATNGQQAVASYREHRPDIVLLDMRMPVMNGFEAVSAICTEFPGSPDRRPEHIRRRRRYPPRLAGRCAVVSDEGRAVTMS